MIFIWVGLKKATWALFQIVINLLYLIRGRARLRPRIVIGDWGDSVSRRKYLSAASITVPQEDLFVKVFGAEIRVCESPQREFFEQLSEGIPFQKTGYYELIKLLVPEREATHFLRQKEQLYRSFKIEESRDSLVAIRSRSGRIVLEDGAHRAALMCLAGADEFEVALSLWFLPGSGD